MNKLELSSSGVRKGSGYPKGEELSGKNVDHRGSYTTRIRFSRPMVADCSLGVCRDPSGSGGLEGEAARSGTSAHMSRSEKEPGCD